MARIGDGSSDSGNIATDPEADGNDFVGAAGVLIPGAQRDPSRESQYAL